MDGQTLYANWVDNSAPTATLTTTNNTNQTTQTATLSCTDTLGVTSYYR